MSSSNPYCLQENMLVLSSVRGPSEHLSAGNGGEKVPSIPKTGPVICDLLMIGGGLNCSCEHEVVEILLSHWAVTVLSQMMGKKPEPKPLCCSFCSFHFVLLKPARVHSIFIFAAASFIFEACCHMFLKPSFLWNKHI